MKYLPKFLLLLLLSKNSFGQSKIPLITGKAKFSIAQGTIECDLTLSEYSFIQDYLIRLNTGLNILNIQSLESKPFILAYNRSLVDSLQTDETNSYYFPSNDRKNKFLPSKLRFQYTGKYPVVKDTLQLQYQGTDWRGNIAFNNNILRMDGLQSAWIPTLYDIKNQYKFSELRYNIEIECLDCDYIYVNGNAPIRATKANFKSDVPREMYLFLGKYSVQKSKGITLLNADFTDAQLQVFSDLNIEVSNFFKSYTGITYQQEIYWVQGNITSKDNAWSFISYPTFTTCGYPPYDLKSGFENNYNNSFLQTIAHELGHFYFGTLKKYNNNLESIINEGFAEFLSLKYLEAKGKNDEVAKEIKLKLESINQKDFECKSMGNFHDIAHTNDRQTYAYDYQTLILLSIEKKIGKDKMRKWIQLILKEDKAISDFDFINQKLKEIVQNENTYKYIVDEFLLSEHSIVSINKALK